jgi:hypothetical protein
MRHIVISLLRLALLYSFLALLVELLLANCSAPDWPNHDWVHVSCVAIDRIAEKVGSLQLGQLKLVEWSLWVFNHRLHFLLLPLLALAWYYDYKRKQLRRPAIGSHTASQADDYESEKQANTQREVELLKNSKEYKDYEWRKRTGQLRDSDDQNGIDW